MIGTSCRRPGVVGIFEEEMTAWEIVGPTLPSGSGQAQVLGLFPTRDGLAALIGLSGGRSRGERPDKPASSLGGHRKAVGKLRPLAASQGRSPAVLRCDCRTAGCSFWSPSQAARTNLQSWVATSHAWRRLPPPPPGTTTVAFGPGSAVDALAAGSTVLTVWHLAGDVGTWAKSQVVQVAIQYGSSS